MSTQPVPSLATPTVYASAGRKALPFTIAFFVLFMGSDFAAGLFRNDPGPRPRDSEQKIYDYFINNGASSIASGICQILASLCLVAYAHVLANALRQPEDDEASIAKSAFTWAVLSGVLYAICGALSIALPLVAPDASVDTVNLLRDLNFLSGGATTVVALGVATFIFSRHPVFSKRLRTFGTVASALAVAAVLAPFIYYANPFIPFGRTACMIWAISAAVSLLRMNRQDGIPAATTQT
jgi:hypothetical protein